MATIEKMISDKSLIGKEFAFEDKKYTLAKVEDFEYTDPIDKSVSKGQVRLL